MKALPTTLTTSHQRLVAAWLLGAMLLGLIGRALADEVDPPDRVARISYLKGQVYVQSAENEDWTDAVINRPLTSGDQLWTDAQARSELQIGTAAVQIDTNTQLRLLELSDDVLQLEITQGSVNLYLRSLGKGETVELDTPNAAISVLDTGTYRISVADHEVLTTVQVRDGKVEIAGEKQRFTLRDGEQVSLRGSQRLAAEFDDLDRMDEFDQWADDRNRRAERVVSSRYVAADVIGYEDLDDYGYWRWYADYGYVWLPTRTGSGWAPYRYGHWSWIAPWGWTWIDDAPWGFAPFHYGRWAMISSHWCWVPGPRVVRAVYAPALVAWIGTPGLSLSVSFGNRPVGWIPLGPREVYRPPYHSSHRHVVNVNLSNSLLDNAEFERGYRRQPHELDYGNRRAASVVQASAFGAGRPVSRNLLRGQGTQLQPLDSAPLGRPGVEVSRDRRVAPPMARNSREVLVRRQPVGMDSDRAGASTRPLRVISPPPSGREPPDTEDRSRPQRGVEMRRSEEAPAGRARNGVELPQAGPGRDRRPFPDGTGSSISPPARADLPHEQRSTPRPSLFQTPMRGTPEPPTPPLFRDAHPDTATPPESRSRSAPSIRGDLRTSRETDHALAPAREAERGLARPPESPPVRNEPASRQAPPRNPAAERRQNNQDDSDGRHRRGDDR